MYQNRDWRPIIVLALAGLAIFAVVRGAHGGRDYDQGNTIPQQIYVQPAAQTGVPVIVSQPPVVIVQAPQTGVGHNYGGWGGGGGMFFPFFPLLFLAGFAFLAFRRFSNGPRSWGGPGGWSGHRPGQQGTPSGQRHSQYSPEQYESQSQQGQGQPTQRIDDNGDVTRPEGSRDF